MGGPKTKENAANGLLLFIMSRLLVTALAALFLARISLGWLGTFVVRAPAALLVVYFLNHSLEKSSLRLLGRAGWGAALGKLILGACAGGGLYVLAFLSRWLMGAVSFQGFIWDYRVPWAAVLLAGLVIELGVGFWEEIVFRGYLLGVLRKRLGCIWAVLLSSLLFAGLHFAFSPGSVLALVNLVLLGTAAAYTVLRYGSIWPAVGLHFAWNWVQYWVLGTNAGEDPQSMFLFMGSPGAPSFLTGTGPYGGEATVTTTLFLVLGIFCLARGLRRKEQEDSV